MLVKGGFSPDWSGGAAVGKGARGSGRLFEWSDSGTAESRWRAEDVLQKSKKKTAKIILTGIERYFKILLCFTLL